MPTFTTPTVDEAWPVNNRLLIRYKIARGISVVKANGHFAESRYPWNGDLESLAEGTDYFLGGRIYTIDDATAAALTTDGFGSYIT